MWRTHMSAAAVCGHTEEADDVWAIPLTACSIKYGEACSCERKKRAKASRIASREMHAAVSLTKCAHSIKAWLQGEGLREW